MRKIKLNLLNGVPLEYKELKSLLGGRDPGECCCACNGVDYHTNGYANCEGGLWSPGCSANNYSACDSAGLG